MIEKVTRLMEAKLQNLTKGFKEENIDYSFTIGVNKAELDAIIYFLIQKLPLTLHLKENDKVLDLALNLISDKLIMFLTREDVSSSEFANNLSIFEDELLFIVNNNILLKN